MFECFTSRHDFHGRLLTETGLHIGAGGSLTVSGSDNPIVRDAQNLPYIPGSSLKGVLRSRIEALVRAISLDNRKRLEPWACDPLNDPCVKAADVEGRDDQQVSQCVEYGTDQGGKACTV